MNKLFSVQVDTTLTVQYNWKHSSLSELTRYEMYLELTHLGSKASNLYKIKLIDIKITQMKIENKMYKWICNNCV